MKRGLALLALLLAATAPAMAQETAGGSQESGDWNVASELNLTLTQNAYSENWSGSESGAASWTLNSNSLAESQLTPSLHSGTTLKLAFGQTHSQDPATNEWKRPVKSTDLVDLESVLKLTRGWVVDPFVAGRLETQFLDESDPSNRRTLNPLVLTESAGIARTLIEEEKRELTMRIGGALKQHIDRDASTGTDDEIETVTTSDAGLEFVSEFRTSLADDRIGLYSKLTAYNALYSSEDDEAAGDDWKSADVNWENTFTANVTNYLMVNLYVQMLYDREVDDAVMFKETLSLGFTFQPVSYTHLTLPTN